MPSFQHLPQQQIDAITAYLKGIDVVADNSKMPDGDESATKEPYGFSGYEFFKDPNGIPAIKPPFATLNAIDLNSGKILWQVPLGFDKKLEAQGIKNSGIFNRGGGIATAGGLIIIGATVDQMFRVFDQKTGKILWEKELPGSATAVPSTYSIGKKQYITVAVSPNPGKGYHGGYITFSLE